MLLGSNDHITSLGEVAILQRYFQENAYCTCGQHVTACDFWLSIAKSLGERRADIFFSLANFPLSVPDDAKNKLMRNIARSMLVLGNRSLWNLLAAIIPKVGNHAAASRNAIELFETVAILKKTPIIVDSSKYPLVLKSLYFAAPERMKIVYLIRDGRGNTCSLMRRHNLTLEEAAKRWVTFNRNLRLVLSSIPSEKIMTIKYEEICTDTALVLERLTSFISPSRVLIQQPLAKERFHNIGGNPMRFNREEKEIVLDEKWRSILSNKDIDSFDKIGGKLNRMLGYTS
jgi:hypothetical protein